MLNLRYYQSEAVEAAFGYLCNHPGNPVISLPTGAGKSVVVAELARRAVEDYGGRVLILQHRKELVEQNADKVSKLYGKSVGINSAGLRRLSTDDDVVLCGIQSVYSKANLFGRRNLVIVDEVHLVPNDGEGMYRTFFEDLRQINPRLRVVGLTATPYRTGEGAITSKGGLFQDLCYDAPVRDLIEKGYLCKLTNKPIKSEADTSKLHLLGGEFILSEMQQLFSSLDATQSACNEIAEASRGRRSVIVFCSGVAHAQEVCNVLSSLTGDRAEMVSGESTDLERAAFIDGFRNGAIRFLVNVDVLTTGFDAPGVDCVALLRATNSPGLYYQMVGRGLRTSPNKQDCLILDFGGNLRRHGPIDAIDFGAKAARKAGNAPVDGPKKECPSCLEEIPASCRTCDCGFEFPKPSPSLDGQADDVSQIISEPICFSVLTIYYALHRKEGKPDSMRVDYECERDGGNITETISEWVCLEHDGFAHRKAHLWWNIRSNHDLPTTATEAIAIAEAGGVAAPRNLTAIKQGKFWRVMDVTLEEVPDCVVVAERVEEMPF
jgi:DNA repair protein RadD